MTKLLAFIGISRLTRTHTG